MAPHSYSKELEGLKIDIQYIKQGLQENKIEHKDIMSAFKDYTSKMDKVLNNKADKSELKTLKDYTRWFIIYIITSLIGLVAYLLGRVIFHG